MSELEPKEILQEAEQLLLAKRPFTEKVSSLLKDISLGVGLGIYGVFYTMGQLSTAPFKYMEALKEVGKPYQIKLAGLMFLGIPAVTTLATYLEGASPFTVVTTGVTVYGMGCLTSALMYSNLQRPHR